MTSYTPCVIAPAFQGQSNPTADGTATMYRYPLTTVRDAADLILVFQGTGDPGVTQTIKAGLEVGGVIYPVYFKGAPSGTVGPGAFLVSDPVPVRVASATQVWSRHYVTGTGAWGEKAVNFASQKSIGGADVSLGGTNPPAATGVYTYPPQTILALSPTGAKGGLALVGDSIGAGVNELGTTPTAATSGFFGRACYANGFGAVRAAQSGIAAVDVIALGGAPLLALAGCCSRVAVELGTNDLTNETTTFAQLTGRLTTVYSLLRGRGQEVWGVTIPPRTNSANTTIPLATYQGGAASVRSQVNAWIRAGGGGLLAGFWDLADALETARDSGFWQSGFTTDGLHPDAPGHAAGAAVVPAGFVR